MRAKSIGIMMILVLAPMVALTASANHDNSNSGSGDSSDAGMDTGWLDNLTVEQVDYSADLNLYGTDLEIRLSSTEMYDGMNRQYFDVNMDGVVDWNDSNTMNGMLNQNMEFNLSDLPEVKLDGTPVTRLIGNWCNFEDIVPNNYWDTTVNESDIPIRLRCEFTLLVEDFNSSTGIVEINSVGDELNVQGNIHASSWHGLNLTAVTNNLADGSSTSFNTSSDGYYWMHMQNGLHGQFIIEFEVDYSEYDVCQEMDGFSFDEAIALAQNLTSATTTATIVMIDDQAEFELVSEILDHNATWVGASQTLDTTVGQVEPADGWTNLDGTALNSSLWAYGEPNDWGSQWDGGEDLVELWPWSGFNDIDEHAYLPVLIEYTHADGSKDYELFGGWTEISCEEQEDWWDWQEMEWIDYSLWLEMIGDELEVVISAHESIEISELLLYGDLDSNGELSETELQMLEAAVTNESDPTDMPNMTVEGESLHQLDDYWCNIWMPSNVNADGTTDEHADMSRASLECKWVYVQQIAYDEQFNLTVMVNEYDSEDERGWLSVGLGWGATRKGYVITDAYDTDAAVTEIELEMFHEDYWGGEHFGDFGTIVMELERLNEPLNDSDWDDDWDEGSEMVDYIAWSNVVGSEVAVELIRIEMIDATQLASLDSDGDGVISDAELSLVEQNITDEMDTSDLPPIYVNDVLLDNLEDYACEIIMLGDEMDSMNLFEVAELECWFYFVDEFEFDDELLIVIDVQEYDYESDEYGIVMAELGEEAANSGWIIDHVYDENATLSGVYFHMVDDYLWEADHNGNHGTYNIKLLNSNSEGDVPDNETEDLPPQCEIAWALHSEMMDMSGQAQAVDPSGEMDVTLGAGHYDLYIYCADPNGDTVDVTVTIAGVEVGTFSAAEAEGYVEFEVPEDAEANVLVELAWTSTDYSGDVVLNITADGSTGGLVIGNVVPGFTGVFTALAMLGAVAFVSRRRL